MEPTGRPGWARCRECDRPVPAGALRPGGICDRTGCRTALVARIERARAADGAIQERRRLARLRRRWRHRLVAAARAADCAPDDVGLGQVPGIAAVRPERLPAKRRAAFEAHLCGVVAMAFRDDPVPPDQPAADTDAPLISAACGACRGACCKMGAASHAFLTPEVIAATRSRRPELGPVAMVAHYLAALPSRSVGGSCVYHGAGGCELERDDRSHLCNRYQCDGLRTILADHRKTRPTLIVARPDKGRARWAVIPPT